ncbi:MAG: phenylacetate--CoA ligase family protein [Proteobacteria bacterium]|nr:phenylacetate--CoA ligase family protein [Pseudomonadota bacterium]
MKSYTERRLWNEKIETMPEEQMRELQWKRLKRQLRYDYENSTYYRRRFETGGITPQDIRSFEDFQLFPLMDKDEHRRIQQESMERFGNPYGMITCAPLEKIVRISATSGTTGIPTLYTLTRHDVTVVNEMHARKYWRAGLRPGHVVLQALSLSMFTGGLPLSDGLQAMGLCCVPVGIEGGTKRVLEVAVLTKPDAIIATPSFGEYLIEKCPEILEKECVELGIKWFLCAGEPGAGIPSVKDRLQNGFGARVFDHTGGGHAFHGISCDSEEYRGMHFVSADHCILELIDPRSRTPIPLEDGAVGEMVFTFIDWEGGPFLRYAYGDVLQIFTKPCDCGFPGMRFKIIGRSDDMLIVKGVNVYPSALKEAVGRFYPRTTGAFKILLDRPGPRVSPPLRLRVEYGPGLEKGQQGCLREEMKAHMREHLRINPEIELVAPDSIPRETQKVKLTEILGQPD